MEIKEISNDLAIAFGRKYKNNDIIVQNHDIWYGVFEGDILINITGINFRKNGILFGGTITRPDYRRRGVNKFARAFLVKKYEGQRMYSYALPENAIMLEKYFGFKTKRKTKYTQYMVREPYGGGEHGETKN